MSHRCTRCGRVAAGALAICPTCGARAPFAAVAIVCDTPPCAVDVSCPPDPLPPLEFEYDDECDTDAIESDTPKLAELNETAGVQVVQAGTTDAEPVVFEATDTPVDHVFGGGLPMGRVVLIGGTRGTGKSRLVTQLLGRLGGLYATAEEDVRDADMRARDALSPRELARVHLVQLIAGEGVDRFVAVVRQLRPRVAVLDSLQACVGELPAQQQLAAIKLKNLSRELGNCVVELSQMNGEGGMRGSKAIEQFCDVIAALEWFNRDKGVVRLRCEDKNRCGPSHLSALLTHGARGFTWEDPS